MATPEPLAHLETVASPEQLQRSYNRYCGSGDGETAMWRAGSEGLRRKHLLRVDSDIVDALHCGAIAPASQTEVQTCPAFLKRPSTA